MKVSNVMFSLLRYVINGEEVSEELKNSINPELLSGLYKLSKMHDLSHLVCVALDDNGLLDNNKEMAALFRQQRTMAVYRFEQISYEAQNVSILLNQEKIPHIPLKGMIIRKFYPEPWMRTSCDIDILVPEKYVDTAANLLTEKLKYKYKGKGSHDVQLYSEGGVHLELHYELIEESFLPETEKLLSKIWEMVTPSETNSYKYVMPDDIFYFYHVAHMAKHFIVGGCGIRPILDLWVMDTKWDYDKAQCDNTLTQAKMLSFANVIRALSKVWFENAEHTQQTKEIAEYILTGGVYGNVQNRVAVEQIKKGGKARYLVGRIFMPYRALKIQFPVLEKHKWLYPFCLVRRWGRLIFCRGRAKQSLNELNASTAITEEQNEKFKGLLTNLELL